MKSCLVRRLTESLIIAASLTFLRMTHWWCLLFLLRTATFTAGGFLSSRRPSERLEVSLPAGESKLESEECKMELRRRGSATFPYYTRHPPPLLMKFYFESKGAWTLVSQVHHYISVGAICGKRIKTNYCTICGADPLMYFYSVFFFSCFHGL